MSLELVFEHLYLVVVSCAVVIAVGIPLGIFTYYHEKLGKIVLTAVDLIQTVDCLRGKFPYRHYCHDSLPVAACCTEYEYRPESCESSAERDSGRYGYEPPAEARESRISAGFSLHINRYPYYCSQCSRCGCLRNICGRRRTGQHSVPRDSDTKPESDPGRNLGIVSHVHVF